MTPGWVRRTSLSWSTTGGVQRVIGRLTTTGPVRSSVRSGTVTSSPRISGCVLAARQLAAHGEDRVLGEQAAGELVGAGEQQHLDRAVEVLHA